MSDPPFGLRDYLAYGMTGLFLVVAAGFAVAGGIETDLSLSATQIVLALIGCYVLGHVLAEATAHWINRALYPLCGGTPLKRMMRERSPGVGRFRARYVGGLSAPVRDQIIEAAARCGVEVGADGTGHESLRVIAAAVVREVHSTPERIERYGLLEDFSRNVAAAGVLSGVVLAAGAGWHGSSELVLAAAAALLTAIVMTGRYLHFQRLYWTVLLVAFAAHVLGFGAGGAAADVTGRAARPG